MTSAAFRSSQLAPAFSNHTPRQFEVDIAKRTNSMDTRSEPKLGPVMLTPVAEDQSSIYDMSPPPESHNADRNIRRYCPNDDHSIQQDLVPEALRLSPILFDDELHNDKLSTRTDLLRLPRSNPSFNVSYFLRTTGPDIPVQIPKLNKAKRTSPMPMAKFGMFKTKPPKNPAKPRLTNVEQKVSTTGMGRPKRRGDSRLLTTYPGTRYLQIVPSGEQAPVTSEVEPLSVVECHDNAAKGDLPVPEQARNTSADPQSLLPVGIAPHLSLDVFESEVSILMCDIENSCNNASDPDPRGRKNNRQPSGQSVRILTAADRSPVRPSAPESPIPNHDSGTELIEEGRPKQSRNNFRKLDASTPLSSNPRSPGLKPKESYTALPPLSQKPSSRDSYGIVQPSPRRAGSHPILARTSSDVSALCWSKGREMEQGRSYSDPPGPPPPRSPLRNLQQGPPSIEDILGKTTSNVEKITENKTPEETGTCNTFLAIGYHQLGDPGTLNRVNSSSASTTDGDAASFMGLGRRFTNHRRTRSKALPVIESFVHAPPPRPRKRLTRARPPGPSSIELTSIRKRVSLTQTQEEASRPPSVVIVPSNNKPREVNHRSVMPMMAPGVGPAFEAVPIPKPMKDRSSIAIPAKGRKSPGPRPRSAKMPNRSPRIPNTPPRSKSPPTRRVRYETNYTPEPPSPPPKRSLPPTPKRTPPRSTEAELSGPQSQINTEACAPSQTTRTTSTQKKPPPLTVLNTTFPPPPSSTGQQSRQSSAPSSAKPLPSPPASTKSIKPEELPSYLESLHGPSRNHSQRSNSIRHSINASRPGSSSTDYEARLRALEKRNQLLEATLMAMIRNSNVGGMTAALTQMRERDDLDLNVGVCNDTSDPSFNDQNQNQIQGLRRDISGGSSSGSGGGSSHRSQRSRASTTRRVSDLNVMAQIGHPAFSRQGSTDSSREMGVMDEESEGVCGEESTIEGLEREADRWPSGTTGLDMYIDTRR